MSEFRKYSLDQIMEIIGGGTPKTSDPRYWNGDIPWLSVVDFNSSAKYVDQTEKSITKKGLEESSTKYLDAGDIIISARGTVGVLAMLRKPMTFNQSCYGLKARRDMVNPHYLYYSLKNIVKDLSSLTNGAVFDTITRSTFEHIKVNLPPLQDQQAIAEVLSSLDDKIDLLHRLNKTLEQLAEILFRQWFLEEADESWEESSPLELFELIGGGTPNTSIPNYWNGEIIWLTAKDISSSGRVASSSEKKITPEGLSKCSARLIPKFSTIITARGTVGKFVLISKEMTFSQSNYGVISKIHSPFYTNLLIGSIISDLKSSSYGTVFDTITRRTFEEIKINKPPQNLIHEFEKTITPFFEKIIFNTQHLNATESFRDKLLPKLLSGSITLK